MTTFVRAATIADAERLSRFGATTFRETFADENSPDDMARYLAEAFTPERQAAEILDPTGTVLLAERRGAPGDGDLLGYVHLVSGATPAAVQAPSPLELKRLYVARACHGQGVAQALMDAALDAARARGAETLWLGVWERNSRALGFYYKYGFTRVGQHTFVLGTDRQTDWVLARSLAEPAPPAAKAVD
jgi:diamine N-acetyltransferase